MAGADVIEAAIGISLLLIVSYVVIGSIITAANTVSNTRKDVTLQNEARLDTDIVISNVSWGGTSSDYLHFNITNTGSEVIGNLNATDVFVTISTDTPKLYKFDLASSLSLGYGRADLGTWAYSSIGPDTTHPGMLDPGEMMLVKIYKFPIVHPNTMVGLTTSNGVSAFFAFIT
jgi:hypothetical protein